MDIVSERTDYFHLCEPNLSWLGLILVLDLREHQLNRWNNTSTMPANLHNEKKVVHT